MKWLKFWRLSPIATNYLKYAEAVAEGNEPWQLKGLVDMVVRLPISKREEVQVMSVLNKMILEKERELLLQYQAVVLLGEMSMSKAIDKARRLGYEEPKRASLVSGMSQMQKDSLYKQLQAQANAFGNAHQASAAMQGMQEGLGNYFALAGQSAGPSVGRRYDYPNQI